MRVCELCHGKLLMKSQAILPFLSMFSKIFKVSTSESHYQKKSVPSALNFQGFTLYISSHRYLKLSSVDQQIFKAFSGGQNLAENAGLQCGFRNC